MITKVEGDSCSVFNNATLLWFLISEHYIMLYDVGCVGKEMYAMSYQTNFALGNQR